MLGAAQARLQRAWGRLHPLVSPAGVGAGLAAGALVAGAAESARSESGGRWAWSSEDLRRTRQYTREQVAEHNTAADCWIVVGDRVFDVTRWLERHPGRPAPILALAGKDATAAFRHFHSKEVFEQYATAFDIGAVAGGALEQQGGVAAQWEEGETATFDYVVVGAGSAGCLLTHRLCSAGHTVCLLEAGGSVAEDTNTSVNGAVQQLLFVISLSADKLAHRPDEVRRGLRDDAELGPRDRRAAGVRRAAHPLHAGEGRWGLLPR